MKHIATMDRDLNHYVIPALKSAEWEEFLDAVDEWSAGAIEWPGIPEWARMVDVSIVKQVAEEMSVA